MGSFEITSKWWSKSYSGEIRHEYPPDTEHEEIWTKAILSHYPKGKKLRVLDVGTGGGYFARLLSAAGHDVTGIDANENALKAARLRCKRAGVSPVFRMMDSHRPDFPDETFDLIVSRNVVWTLYDPAIAFLEWKRILKSGGKIIIYDANWHLEFYHPEIARQVRENEKRCKEQYGVDMRVCTDDKAYYDILPLSDVKRPEWDIKTLERLGYENVSVKQDISDIVYNEWERCIYKATPFFEICAVKPAGDPQKQSVREYWNKARELSVYPEESLKKWSDIYGAFLPEGKKLRILDAGTGGGFIACSLARAGHEVTGVDISDERIKNAKENAKALGLDIDFICTDAGELPFEDDTFDAVVCRNLVWTLYDAEDVFRSWKRILKPGGVVLYTDANWFYYLFNKEAALKFDPEIYPYSLSEEYKICEESAKSMPLSSLKRPEWDVAALEKTGFRNAGSSDITETARTPEEQNIYAFAPLFVVYGCK